VARLSKSDDLRRCSFCGKSEKQVQRLFAGPGVSICDQCVEEYIQIIEEEQTDEFGLPVKPWDMANMIRDWMKTMHRHPAATIREIRDLMIELTFRLNELLDSPT